MSSPVRRAIAGFALAGAAGVGGLVAASAVSLDGGGWGPWAALALPTVVSAVGVWIGVCALREMARDDARSDVRNDLRNDLHNDARDGTDGPRGGR